MVMLLLTVSLPILAYFTIPTLKNKIAYMTRDIQRFSNGENVNYYSDGNRLLSISLGLELANKTPLLGVGIGDVQKKMFKAYDDNHPEISSENRLIPHNQYVYVYLGCGLIGLIGFIIATSMPFFIQEGYTNGLFISIHALLISSFISEATIENQLGVALFSVFYLMSWQTSATETNNHEERA